MTPRSATATDCYVGQRIRARRLGLGKTQEWLGDRLGVTFQQVQKYEKGANRVGASRMQQLAHVLEVPVSYFFDGGPHADGRPTGVRSRFDAVRFMATRYGVRISRAFPKIKSEKLQRHLVRLIETAAR